MQQGKAGRTTKPLAADSPVRDLFRHTEDFLTSTVFERLSYLPGPVAWHLLCATFPDLPKRRMVEMRDVAFWPRWSPDGAEGDGGTGYVEPDVVLTLDLGDPPLPAMLIVEAKTTGAQYAGQWEAQLRAAFALEERKDMTIIFAALGGCDKAGFRAIRDAVDPALRQKATFVHGDWHALGRAVVTMACEDAGTARLLSDIDEALSLYGYHAGFLSESLFALPPLADPDTAFATLTRGNGL